MWLIKDWGASGSSGRRQWFSYCHDFISLPFLCFQNNLACGHRYLRTRKGKTKTNFVLMSCGPSLFLLAIGAALSASSIQTCTQRFDCHRQSEFITYTHKASHKMRFANVSKAKNPPAKEPVSQYSSVHAITQPALSNSKITPKSFATVICSFN